MAPSMRKSLRKVLATYMRYDQVLQIVKSKEPEVIPLGMTIERATVREFAALKRGSSVIFVVDDSDYPTLSVILDPLRRDRRESIGHTRFNSTGKDQGFETICAVGSSTRRYFLAIKCGNAYRKS